MAIFNYFNSNNLNFHFVLFRFSFETNKWKKYFDINLSGETKTKNKKFDPSQLYLNFPVLYLPVAYS